ncbi:hypothetical protein PMNALOAF_4258 [Methylobacterium adhaesivum]|uniref:Response regulator n=1 Tax=Methylobacterium adhaesivum TaxID=333297 RepID=A0ABT8BKD6_9HYPH|nr:response regulator [Methylobacterium adhaesivum]MDN3591995.1 response regulator [Methylobacterium adhaesivum]GJD32977.1 hypothetical protein PMNALOAF_4258 [Methylobacterium adhaesivum]
MSHGPFSSFRSLLLVLLASAAALGGLPLLILDPGPSGFQPCCEADLRIRTSSIAERIDQALRSVERDLGLVTESLAIHPPERDADGADRLLVAWRRLRPEYADLLFTDRAGRILAAAHPRIIGADVSGSRWFARAQAGSVIGEAPAESQTGTASARNIIVAAPVREGGSAIGVAAVQLAPDWIDGVVAEARRVQPDANHRLSISVLNGTGHVLHKSGPDVRGPEFSATVGDVNRGGVGWLVTVRIPEPAAPTSPALALLCAIVLAAAAGYLIGGRLKRSLDVAEALCGRADTTPPACWPLTRDLHHLTATIRSEIERSLVRERLLRETRAALARSRDRIQASRVLSGSTCWEIDLATGQVVWTDGDGAQAERVCVLDDILVHIEPADHAVIHRALREVHAQSGTVREMVVRTRAGTQRISGRLLALRISKMAGPNSSRLYALSRASIEPAVSGPSSVPTLRHAEHWIAPSMLRRTAELASGDASVDGGTISAATSDALFANDFASALDRIVTFLRGATPAATSIAVSLDADLPPLCCQRSVLALLLFNLLGASGDTEDTDGSVTLRIEAGRRNQEDGIHVSVSAGCDLSIGEGMRATRFLVDELGGGIEVGGHPYGCAVTVWLPMRPLQVDLRTTTRLDSILVLEPDPALRDGLTRMLTDLGCEITSVRDTGRAAALMATDRLFDLILCSHALPATDRSQLAAIAALQEPRIRLLTTTTRDTHRTDVRHPNVVFRAPSDPDLVRASAEWSPPSKARAA